MSISIAGTVRVVLVAVAAAGMVTAAARQPGSVVVGAPSRSGQVSSGATTTVRGASLVCPGPELKGVPGVGDLPVGVRIAATTAPLRALTGTPPVAAPGQVTVKGMPQGTMGAPLTSRGASVSDDLSDPRGVVVSGTESLAPGLAAVQSWLVPSGDQRSLGSVPCGPAGADFWILAGGGRPGRQERLVLTNPGGNAVSVDVTLHGPDGPVASSSGKGLVVPPHGRTSFLLDSISGTVTTPAFHVVAQGGVVGAVVNDLWLEGTQAAGSDDAIPSAAPSRDQVIPAVTVAGPAVLRVAVPGDAEAVVQARVLTAQGPRALPSGGVTRVGAGTVQDIDISGLPSDAVALQVRADVPVVAAAMVGRYIKGSSDEFAWVASTAPITGVAGMPLVEPAGAPGPLNHFLALAATREQVGVEVVTVDGQGVEQSQRITVAPDSTTGLKVNGYASVWVHRVSGAGELRAGVVSWMGDRLGTLITTTPLLDTALRTTTVGLREVRD